MMPLFQLKGTLCVAFMICCVILGGDSNFFSVVSCHREALEAERRAAAEEAEAKQAAAKQARDEVSGSNVCTDIT